MPDLRLALVREVFAGAGSDARFWASLAAARAAGADLALLPELPLDPWLAASRDARAADAELAGGPRHQRLAAAARGHGLGLVGGAIVRDPAGRRHNTALLFDHTGTLVARYHKAHLPNEPGFYETAHYEPGNEPPRRVDAYGLSLGVQICSDNNRPEGTHLLGALGAELVLAPRATEAATWERWKLVLRANALTSACYVASVNRPAPESGVEFGGPSLVVAPDGEILVETEDPLVVVELSTAAVAAARRRYPGYLAQRTALYAAGWSAAAPGR